MAKHLAYSRKEELSKSCPYLKFGIALLAVILMAAISLSGCKSQVQASSDIDLDRPASERDASDLHYFLTDTSEGANPFGGAVMGALYSPNTPTSTMDGTSCPAGALDVEVGWTIDSQSPAASEMSSWKNFSLFYTLVFYDSSNEPLFVHTADKHNRIGSNGTAIFSIVDDLYQYQIDEFGTPSKVDVYISHALVETKNGNYLNWGLDYEKVVDMNTIAKKDLTGLLAALDLGATNIGTTRIQTM